MAAGTEERTGADERAGAGEGAGAALAAGRICATAGQGARAMRSWAAEYPALYGDETAYDPTLFVTLSLASAFSGPSLSAADLRVANRVCLWCFALDGLIDSAARTRAEVDAAAARCLAVAGGAPPVPGDDLTRFLADVRAELAALPAYERLAPVWLDDLRAMLDAMAREWDWAAAIAAGGPKPTVEEYLANADNLGFSFVFTAHWIASGGGGDAAAVRAASAAVQRVVRLLNDLGTYERDVRSGDLNVLLLDEDRDRVQARVADLLDAARAEVAAVRDGAPGLAEYLDRQMDFCRGFYREADFWGI
ncbi:terpene synthase family protein [Actinomadura parmotrematis]|uniref:Terpene synthase family protein n=1 Tax=Actinomadura parmotrematis TaxID=2864039 RepID=A0ABS7FWV6_9ACTN|nr:terpene synthase family protein [Actinomadura parmotrematis]MBW8484801.1 terpene synthase family protein [Actinomadura parmotrematis]